MKREQGRADHHQFDYPVASNSGLNQMDFLGLRNLTVLDDAIDNIRDNRGEEIDLDALRKPSTIRPPINYWRAGTRWAFSSSTAAACAPCSS